MLTTWWPCVRACGRLCEGHEIGACQAAVQSCHGAHTRHQMSIHGLGHTYDQYQTLSDAAVPKLLDINAYHKP